MEKSEENESNSKSNFINDQKEIGELGICIFDVLHLDIQKEEEPFEHYAHQLRMRLYGNSQVFQSHFMQGYEILLETLRSNRPG